MSMVAYFALFGRQGCINILKKCPALWAVIWENYEVKLSAMLIVHENIREKFWWWKRSTILKWLSSKATKQIITLGIPNFYLKQPGKTFRPTIPNQPQLNREALNLRFEHKIQFPIKVKYLFENLLSQCSRLQFDRRSDHQIKFRKMSRPLAQTRQFTAQDRSKFWSDKKRG